MLIDKTPSFDSFVNVVKPYSGFSLDSLNFLYKFLRDDDDVEWDLDPVVIRTAFHEYDADDPEFLEYPHKIIHTLKNGRILIQFLDV